VACCASSLDILETKLPKRSDRTQSILPSTTFREKSTYFRETITQKGYQRRDQQNVRQGDEYELQGNQQTANACGRYPNHDWGSKVWRSVCGISWEAVFWMKGWLHLLSHILGYNVSHRAFIWKGRSYVQILDRMTCHEHEELVIV
jgi:hypothetical protein